MSTRSVLLFAAVSVLLMAFAISVTGCGLFGDAKAPDERAIARGAVLATADAITAADQACATYGTLTHDVDLLASCAKHYDVARTAIIATASAVDLWDRAATHESVTCALVDALNEVDQVGAELGKKGGTVPAVLTDARALVAALGGCSHG